MFDINAVYIPTKALRQHWTRSSFSYMENPRPDYGFMLVLSGQIDFVLQNRSTLIAKAGDLLFLPKGSYYEARFRVQSGAVSNYLINFETDGDFQQHHPVKLSCNVSFVCADLFRQCVDAMYGNDVLTLQSKGLFYLLLDAISKQHAFSNAAPNKVFEKAKSMLVQPEEPSVCQIAKACSVSESGLRKIFVSITGMSPLQYRMKEKLNQAKYLLESTDMSVGEISDKLNFYDAAYFCRMFQQKNGMTPKQYRQNQKL